jgi:hypothetical protein
MIETANKVNVDAVIQTAHSSDSGNLQEITALLQSITEPQKLPTKTFYSHRHSMKPSRYLLNAYIAARDTLTWGIKVRLALGQI